MILKYFKIKLKKKILEFVLIIYKKFEIKLRNITDKS